MANTDDEGGEVDSGEEVAGLMAAVREDEEAGVPLAVMVLCMGVEWRGFGCGGGSVAERTGEECPLSAPFIPLIDCLFSLVPSLDIHSHTVVKSMSLACAVL